MQKQPTVSVPAGKYAEQIARGAAALDEELSGWRVQIDLDDLNIWSCTRCILGQLYGDFASAPEAIYNNAEYFGFDAISGSNYQTEARRLTDEWIAYIEATR